MGFLTTNGLARTFSGIANVRTRNLVDAHRATMLAFGDLSAATANMGTHVHTDPRRWTVLGRWKRGATGWRLPDR